MINYFQTGGTQLAAPSQAAIVGFLYITFSQSAKEKGINDELQVMQAVSQALQDEQTMQQAAQQVSQLQPEQQAQCEQVGNQLLQAAQGNQPIAAKYGAKLAYIHNLRTGCLPDEELHYFLEGGKVCKKCLKKAAAMDKCGGKAKKKEEGGKVAEEKCGDKTKKKYFGGVVEIEKCGGKTKKKACGGEVKKEKCGGKAKKAKCAKCGMELDKCKCGCKTKKRYFGGIL